VSREEEVLYCISFIYFSENRKIENHDNQLKTHSSKQVRHFEK